MKKQKLINTFDSIKCKFENAKDLDAMWVAVVYDPKKWREAKAIGCKKDSYYGWILWSGSVNCNGNDFSHEIHQISIDSGLPISIRCRQL